MSRLTASDLDGREGHVWVVSTDDEYTREQVWMITLDVGTALGCALRLAAVDPHRPLPFRNSGHDREGLRWWTWARDDDDSYNVTVYEEKLA